MADDTPDQPAQLSDIARNYGNATPGGFAADSRPEGARVYPSGTEPHGAKDAAHHGGDLAK